MKKTLIASILVVGLAVLATGVVNIVRARIMNPSAASSSGNTSTLSGTSVSANVAYFDAAHSVTGSANFSIVATNGTILLGTATSSNIADTGVTGLLKCNGSTSACAAGLAGTDFQSPSSTWDVANGGTASTTLGGLLKGNGTNGVASAIAGTDYLTLISQDTAPKLGAKLDTNRFDIQLDQLNAAGSNGLSVTGTIGDNVNAGDLLYVSSTASSPWKSASALSANMAPVVGMAEAQTASGSVGQILLHGYFYDSGANWSAPGTGKLAYLGTSTGTVTSVQPTVVGTQVQKIGVWLTSTLLYFDPSLNIVQN